MPACPACRRKGHFICSHPAPACLVRSRPDGKPIECARDFAAYLLESENVAVLPGEDCGVSPYVRASFAVAPERLREAGVRIMRACAAIHRSKSTTRTSASQEGDQRAPNEEKSGWAVKFC